MSRVIDRLRADRDEAQITLEAAYLEEFTVGTTVYYSIGRKIIEVDIVKEWGPHRCKVRNLRTHREYLLDYDRIAGVVL